MIYSTGLNAIIEVSKNGSFSSAAKALGISAAAVSKQVKLIEEQLGFVVFNRTTRSVVVTDAGQQLISCLDRNRDEINALLENVSGQQKRPYGRLRLNAPIAFGERFLVDPIAEYARLYPDVTVDVEFNDNRVHLIEDGYDLVIRIGRLGEPGLIAKRLCNFTSCFCASPEFLTRHFTPENAHDLSKLSAVAYRNAPVQINYRGPNLQDGNFTMQPAIYANSIGMLLEATIRGVGYAVLPAFACEEYLKNGKLIRLLPDYTLTPDMGIYAIYPDRRYLPLKVRKFIDLLSKSLSDFDAHQKI